MHISTPCQRQVFQIIAACLIFLSLATHACSDQVTTSKEKATGLDASTAQDSKRFVENNPDQRQPREAKKEDKRPEVQCVGCLLFTGGQLFDGKRFRQDGLLVKNKKILRFVPANQTVSGATIVDLKGKSLLPGLIDLHVHLSPSAGPYGYRANKRYHEAHLKAMLRAGVTSFLDLGTSAKVIFTYRQRLKQGFLLGPTLFAAGPLLTPSGGHPCTKGQPIGDSCILLDNPQDIEKVKTLIKTYKPDVLKGVIEGGDSFRTLPRLKPDYLAQLQQEARRTKIPVVAHVGSAQDIIDSLDKGVRVFGHIPITDKLPPTLLQRMAKEKVIVIPTLIVIESLYRIATAKFSTQGMEADVPAEIIQALNDPTKTATMTRASYQKWVTQRHTIALDNVKQLLKAGITVAAGSDAGNPGTFHGVALHQELQLYVSLGMSPSEALTTATTTAANVLGLNDRGVLKADAFADLLIVEGDASKSLKTLGNIVAVYKEGQRLDRDSLDIRKSTSLLKKAIPRSKAGEVCVHDRDCEMGYACDSFDSICTKSCQVSIPKSCPKGSVCFASTIGAKTGTCLKGDGCDLFKQNCPNQAACIWLGNGASRCWFASSATNKQACARGGSCAPGYQCNFRTNQCYELCDPSSAKRKTCGLLRSCQDLTSYAGLTVGACQ